MISIKFLLATSLRYKTGLLWELGTWSHRFFNTFSLSLFSFFAWPWKIWVRDKTRPTAYLKRKLPCWGSLEKNTNNRWHLRRVSDYIVVSPQLRLISKKEAGGREDPEKLGFGPFSETFSTRLVDFEDSNASWTTPWTTKKILTENLRQIPYKFK